MPEGEEEREGGRKLILKKKKLLYLKQITNRLTDIADNEFPV